MKQQRNTAQRQLVLDTVTARCDHPTADAIYLAARAADEKISRGTVYRNLNLLAESGEVRQVKVPGADRFDRRTDDHSHLLCTRCGRVVDAPIPYDALLDERLSAETGFAVSHHDTVFEGLCPDCRQEKVL